MARARTRAGAFGRGQMQKGMDASRGFGRGFAKLAGGVADIVGGVASAGSQAASAAERAFNRPKVAPVSSSTPGTLGAPAAAATSTAPATTRNPAGPPMPAASSTATPAARVPLPPRRGDGAAPKMAQVSTAAPAAATTDTYSGGRNKAAFDAAFNKARELGGSTARFTFDGKQYQAAKTKDEYVSKGFKDVDIGDLSKNVASTAAPAAATPQSTGSTATPTSDTDEKPKGSVTVNAPLPPKKPANLQEEVVTVGANKYRIV